jgi:hypothetical protein
VLAEERIPPDEPVVTAQIIDVFRQNLLQRYSTRKVERGANAKTYSVVRAEFRVLPGLPDDLAQGIFRETLRREDVTFDFMVQFQKDAHRQPIEDGSIEWRESETPFIPVAELRIPKQEFASLAQLDFADVLSLNPWHSLPDHRPLGGINRSRKALYWEQSRLRQQLNGVEHHEPTGDELFA